MKEQEDPIDRFLMSWKGMIVWAVVFFVLYGLLVYGLNHLWFESSAPVRSLYGRSAIGLFGQWSPWLAGSPLAGVGLWFSWAAAAVAREEQV